MPWTGSVFIRYNGVFSGPIVWTDDYNAGTLITSDHHDTHDQDLAGGISACLNKNGANTPTSNISWGSFKITNLAYGSADHDSAAYGQTVTAAAIDPASKILTLTRAQGNVTVDLTPIVVAGDTSDFARLSLANAWAATNTFNTSPSFPAGIDLPTGWRLTADSIGNARLLYSDVFTGTVTFIPTADGTVELYLDGSKALTENNFSTAGLCRTAGDFTVAGNWTVTGAWTFSQPLQVGTSLTLAGSGYSWTASVPGPNTYQLAGTGGAFLKISPDVTYTSKLEVSSNTYWHNGNMAILTAMPTGGVDGAVAFVTTGADKGVWVKVSGTWTKIAS